MKIRFFSRYKKKDTEKTDIPATAHFGIHSQLFGENDSGDR